MSNEDAINILSGNWGTAFTADDVPEIRRKAAAEARAALLAEVLAVVDERISHNDDVWRNGAHIEDNAKALERKRELNAIRTRLAALNSAPSDQPS